MFNLLRLKNAVIVLLFSGTSVLATDVNWNCQIGSVNYTSAGAPNLMGEGFVFELGAFKDNFVPTSGNVSLWASKWIALDRDFYNPVSRFFTSKATITSNAAPFTFNSPGYIWGFNMANPGEWILLKNPAWVWPFAGGAGLPVIWSVANVGTTAVVGSVNGSGFQMRSALVSQDPPKVNPDAWLQQFFSAVERTNPSISGWDADPDCDGANNLTELAAGTDPEVTSSHPEIGIELVDTGGGMQVVELRLPRSHCAAITYSAQSSGSLASGWNSAGLTVQSDTLLELVLRLPAGGTRQFVRMSFSL